MQRPCQTAYTPHGGMRGIPNNEGVSGLGAARDARTRAWCHSHDSMDVTPRHAPCAWCSVFLAERRGCSSTHIQHGRLRPPPTIRMGRYAAWDVSEEGRSATFRISVDATVFRPVQRHENGFSVSPGRALGEAAIQVELENRRLHCEGHLSARTPNRIRAGGFSPYPTNGTGVGQPPGKVHALHRSCAATTPTPGVHAWSVRTLPGRCSFSPGSRPGSEACPSQATADFQDGGSCPARISER
jgi:hypothetical protein